jgi:hypothetical protein
VNYPHVLTQKYYGSWNKANEISFNSTIQIVISIFTDRTLNSGVNDTWKDNDSVLKHIIVTNPTKENVPIWLYHSDHLGSSLYITDVLGKPCQCQYVEYLPFGEIMKEQSINNVKVSSATIDLYPKAYSDIIENEYSNLMKVTYDAESIQNTTTSKKIY